MKRRRQSNCCPLPSTISCTMLPPRQHTDTAPPFSYCRSNYCCCSPFSTKNVYQVIFSASSSDIQPTCSGCQTSTTTSVTNDKSCCSPFSHFHHSNLLNDDNSEVEDRCRLRQQQLSSFYDDRTQSLADDRISLSTNFGVLRRRKVAAFDNLLLLAMIMSIAIPAALGVVSSPPRMLRQSPPELYFQMHIDGNSQRSVVLECEAEGEPQPSYYWLKNNRPFDVAQFENEQIQQQPGRGTLVIQRPRLQHEGIYQCFAQNEHGVSVSNRVLLKHACKHSRLKMLRKASCKKL